MDSKVKLDPDSWAYAHTVMSYMKDATGLFRRPQSDGALRKALRATFHECTPDSDYVNGYNISNDHVVGEMG